MGIKIAAIITLLMLAGCATPDPIYIAKCPPLAEYSPQEQAKAASEIEAMPPGAVIPGFIADYGMLRKKCRVLEKNAASQYDRGSGDHGASGSLTGMNIPNIGILLTGVNQLMLAASPPDHRLHAAAPLD